MYSDTAVSEEKNRELLIEVEPVTVWLLVHMLDH